MLSLQELKKRVVDEVEFAAHSAYAGTEKQDYLLIALDIIRELPEYYFEDRYPRKSTSDQSEQEGRG